jgi:myo-inositol-1(or 4)-monophosphatase
VNARALENHQIHREEAGVIGMEDDWLWLIDPLDRTRIALQLVHLFFEIHYLMYKREPVLGVVYEPLTERLFVSVIGERTSCNHRHTNEESPNIFKGNIGWIQGHGVINDPQAVKLRQHIDIRF